VGEDVVDLPGQSVAFGEHGRPFVLDLGPFVLHGDL
jgi:hypothetical protein